MSTKFIKADNKIVKTSDGKFLKMDLDIFAVSFTSSLTFDNDTNYFNDPPATATLNHYTGTIEYRAIHSLSPTSWYSRDVGCWVYLELGYYALMGIVWRASVYIRSGGHFLGIPPPKQSTSHLAYILFDPDNPSPESLVFDSFSNLTRSDPDYILPDTLTIS